MEKAQKTFLAAAATAFLLLAFSAEAVIWVDGKKPKAYTLHEELGPGIWRITSGYKDASYIGPAGAELTVDVELKSRITAKPNGKYDYWWSITNFGTGPMVDYEDSGNGPNFLQAPPLYGTAGPDRIPGTPDDVPPQSEEDEALDKGPPKRGRWGGQWNPNSEPAADRFEPGPDIVDVYIDTGAIPPSTAITWVSELGDYFCVESSYNVYDYTEDNMFWTMAADWIPGDEGTTTWWDEDPVPQGGRRFYRVFRFDSGPTLQWSMTQVGDTVGAMSIQLENGRNMVSSPFEPYPDGGIVPGEVPGQSSLDKAIGDQLTGHPVSQWASDQISAWDPGAQTYVLAWLRAGQGWKAWDSMDAPPTFEIEADKGYWFTINNYPTDVKLCGAVSKTDRTIDILPNRNLIGTCFAASCPLDESNLVRCGFTGHPVSQWASDKIEFWDPWGQIYEGVWYMAGQGWREWGSMVNPPMREFQPGEGFWLTANNYPFEWSYPVPSFSLRLIGDFMDGEPYTYYEDYVTATGGVPPYSFTVHDGYLPDGLYLSQDGDDALVSGSPQYSGTYEFSIRVWDSDTPQNRSTREYSIYIGGPTSVPCK